MTSKVTVVSDSNNTHEIKVSNNPKLPPTIIQPGQSIDLTLSTGVSFSVSEGNDISVGPPPPPSA